MQFGIEQWQALEAGGIGTWQRDLNTDLLVTSSVTSQLLGLPPSPHLLSAGEWRALIVQDDLPLIELEMARAIAEKNVFSLEFRLFRADAQIVWVLSRGIILYTPQNVPEKAMGICFANRPNDMALPAGVFPSSDAPFPPSGKNLLTKKQCEVLQCAIEGMSVRETAAALNISEGTVREHQRDARNRLGARSLLQTVFLAIQHGLI